MYIVFNDLNRNKNLREFDKWEKEVEAVFEYPNNSGTTNYTQPILHPTLPLVAMYLLQETFEGVKDERKAYSKLVRKFGEPTIVDSLTPDWFESLGVAPELTKKEKPQKAKKTSGTV